MSRQGRNFRDSYKKRSLCFGDNDGRRILRAENLIENRKDRRTKAFQNGRHIAEVISPVSQCTSKECSPVLNEVRRNDRRLKALKQWKEEKERKIRLQKKIEKPAFRVGIVKHKAYSPLACYCDKENCKSQACAHTKSKVKKESKLMNCATPQLSRKPNQLSSNQKKILPRIESGRVKRLQLQLENVEKSVVAASLTSPVPSGVKKNNKLTSIATPQLSRKPNQLSSSRKNILPRVDSGRVKRLRPELNDVEKPALVVPLTSRVQSVENHEKGVVNLEQNNVEYCSSTTGTASFPSDDLKRCRPGVPTETVADEKTESELVKLPEESKTENTRIATSPKLKFTNISEESKSMEVERNVPDETQRKVEVQDGDLEVEDFPAMHSPYITTTRGKNRSDAKRKDCSFPGVFSSTPTRYLQGLSNMLSEQDEERLRGVNFFRLKLKMELGLLHNLCDYWSAFKKLNEDKFRDCQDLIDSAVGQSKLLIMKKMAQFESLIGDCECEKEAGEKPVTIDDLEGFWDVMYIQVIDVRKRFCTLEGLYLDGGQKLDTSSKQKNLKKTTKGKKVAEKVKPKVEAKSSMRAMIAAARKKQKEETSTNVDTHNDITVSEVSVVPVPTTPQATPRRRSGSLHKQVLLRESRRKTVTWDATSDLTTATNREESFSISTNATPKSVLKKKSFAEQIGKSDQMTKDVSTVHFQEAEVSESSPRLEYSVTPYVRRSRRSRYSCTPKQLEVSEELPGFETPVQEPARVRRSKRISSMGVK